MRSVSSPRTASRRFVVAFAAGCGCLVVLDLVTSVLAAVSVGMTVLFEYVAVMVGLLAAGVTLLVLVAPRSERGTACAPVATGAIAAILLLMLGFLGLHPPVCDFAGGDSCGFGVTEAPQWYAWARGLVTVVCCGMLVALVGVVGSRPARRPLHRAVAVPLLCSAATTMAICAVTFVTVRLRLDAYHDRAYLVERFAARAYGVAWWLTVSAFVLGAAAVLLAVSSVRASLQRAGVVRAFGGVVCTGFLPWTLYALGANMGVRPVDGYAAVPSYVPVWYMPTLVTLAVATALAGAAGIVMLLVGRR